MADPSHDLTTHRDAILPWLRAREDAMASLLAELVAIPSENPPGKNYRACVDLLQCRSKQMGLDCERLGPFVPAVNAEDSPECLVAFHGNGEQTLYFTVTTTLFRHKRLSNSSPFEKTISRLDAALAT